MKTDILGNQVDEINCEMRSIVYFKTFMKLPFFLKHFKILVRCSA